MRRLEVSYVDVDELRSIRSFLEPSCSSNNGSTAAAPLIVLSVAWPICAPDSGVKGDHIYTQVLLETLQGLPALRCLQLNFRLYGLTITLNSLVSALSRPIGGDGYIAPLPFPRLSELHLCAPLHRPLSPSILRAFVKGRLRSSGGADTVEELGSSDSDRALEAIYLEGVPMETLGVEEDQKIGGIGSSSDPLQWLRDSDRDGRVKYGTSIGFWEDGVSM